MTRALDTEILDKKIQKVIKNYFNNPNSSNSGNLKSENLVRENNDIIGKLAGSNNTKYVMNSLSRLINNYRELADLKQGIVQTRIPRAIEGVGSDELSDVIIRDCRRQLDTNSTPAQFRTSSVSPEKKPDLVPEAWLAVLGGEVRGAVKLAEMYQLPNFVTKNILQSFARTSQSFNTNNSEANLTNNYNNFSKELLRTLNSTGANISSEHLAKARDFTNFEDEHEHVITIANSISRPEYSLDNVYYPMWASLKVAPLSREAIREYEPIQKLKQTLFNSKNPTLKNQDSLTNNQEFKNTPSWFKSLNLDSQNLILSYVDKIIENNSFLPTQLRELVGLRNAYLDVRGIVYENGNMNLDPVHEFHSGTLAYFPSPNNNSQQEVDRITAQNFASLNQLAGGKELKVEALNTEYDSKKGIYHNVLASLMSDERTISERLRSGYQQFKDRITGANKVSFDINATNNAAAAYKTQVMNKLADKSINTPQDQAVSQVMCKSGKDRTGMVILNNFAEKVSQSIPKENKQNVYDSLVYSNHIAFLPGHHGGTRGISGLKASGVFAGLNNHPLEKYKERFVSNIAYTNSIPNLSAWDKVSMVVKETVKYLKDSYHNFSSAMSGTTRSYDVSSPPPPSYKEVNRNPTYKQIGSEPPPPSYEETVTENLNREVNRIKGTLDTKPSQKITTKPSSLKRTIRRSR